jgi:hypothetical protein
MHKQASKQASKGLDKKHSMSKEILGPACVCVHIIIFEIIFCLTILNFFLYDVKYKMYLFYLKICMLGLGFLINLYACTYVKYVFKLDLNLKEKNKIK